jgi:hypothetical protein
VNTAAPRAEGQHLELRAHLPPHATRPAAVIDALAHRDVLRIRHSVVTAAADGEHYDRTWC